MGISTGFTRITKTNWHKFESGEDSVTLEPYAIGDMVAKCGNCHKIFHAKYINNGQCPSCKKPYVREPIMQRPVKLKIGGVRPPVNQGRSTNNPSWREIHIPNFVYTTLRTLCWISLIISAAALLAILFADFPYPKERLDYVLRYLSARFDARIWKPLLSFQAAVSRQLGSLFQSQTLSSKVFRAGRLWEQILSGSFNTIRSLAEAFISLF